MTVAELKAILDTLPDDMLASVLHEQTTFHTPELFVSNSTVLFVAGGSPAREVARCRPHWKRLTESEYTL